MSEDWRKFLNDPETNERAKHTDALCALQIMVNMGWMNEAMYVRGMAFLERYKAGIPVHRDGLRVSETPDGPDIREKK